MGKRPSGVNLLEVSYSTDTSRHKLTELSGSFAVNLQQCCVDDQPEGSLMLAGNPITGACNQVQIGATCVAKDFLNRGSLWWIEGDAGYAKTERFPVCGNHCNTRANMHVA